MEIILSKQCQSLTGSLGKGFGYAIQRRTDLDGRTRFWGVRKSTGAVPPDGHLKFILACAELAQAKLHITDISIEAQELWQALIEAGLSSFAAALKLMYGPTFPPRTLNAKQVLDFAEEYKLKKMLK